MVVQHLSFPAEWTWNGRLQELARHSCGKPAPHRSVGTEDLLTWAGRLPRVGHSGLGVGTQGEMCTRLLGPVVSQACEGHLGDTGASSNVLVLS